MNSKERSPCYEERQQHDACDQWEPPMMRNYLYPRAKRWQVWVGGFLMVLGALTFSLALGSVLEWCLGAALYHLRWLWIGVRQVESGVVGWKWGEVSLRNVTLKTVMAPDTSQIRPSTNILWHTCHEQYDCARLEVNTLEVGKGLPFLLTSLSRCPLIG